MFTQSRLRPNTCSVVFVITVAVACLLLLSSFDDIHQHYYYAAAQDYSLSGGGGGGGGMQQQAYPSSRLVNFRRERVSWCTTSLLERKKCLDWARAIEDVNVQFEGQEPLELNLDCAQGSDKDHCMSMIDDEKADMILLDAGEIGVAGRYHSLTPIMAERYAGSFGGGGGGNLEMGHYSVAVIKKRSSIQKLEDLLGRKACFSGVSHMASWILPLASLIELPRFEITDCNNLVKSASYFFGNSCAPNAMINKFNPTGDNPPKMSILCERQNAHVGAHSEPYSGAFSALKCLAEPMGATLMTSSMSGDARGGDVAFLPHNTVFLSEKLNLPRELRLSGVPSRNDLELLCPQGGRAPLDRWQSCNFGFAPAHALVVSSRSSPERRASIQRFLKTCVQLFSGHISSDRGTPSTQQQPDPLLASRQQQQQPASQSSFDIGFSRPQSSAFDLPQQSMAPPPLVVGGTINSNKINTNFKLNGDYSFQNYPALDVLFSSDMVDLVPLVGVSQTFKGFLNSFPIQLATTSASLSSAGQTTDYSASPYYSIYQRGQSSEHSGGQRAIRDQMDYFEKLRQCPVPAAVLCVTSEREFSKCQAMSKAFHAAGLKPVLNCKLAQSSLACMQLIRNRDADLVALDAADIYIAGTKFGLIPIVAEQIEAYESSHYAVAVAKKSDRSTDLFTLKGKLTCHSGYLKGAGWVMPMHFLLSNDRIRKYDSCDSARSAAEHFDKSCAPGVLSSVSSTQNVTAWTIRNMCELCHGSGANYCARDASEPFYGDTGSFRCLVEGGGDVAFCKHTALFENTGGSNKETWARNLIKSDFELLCRDGSRAPVNEYKSCNLGSVPSNAIVTRGDTGLSLVEAYVNLFMYGQQYYGSRYSEEYTFKMFSSIHGRDLIFQDATQQLVRVPLANQTYSSYLGYDFTRAVENMFCS